MDIAIEEGVRFFIASRGDVRTVLARLNAVGGKLYQDITMPRRSAPRR